jgi:histidinol-phosphatase (PHP family)
MKYTQNLHTHTTHCDGKNAAEEMIETALSLGFTELRFSAHSYNSYSPRCYRMTIETTEEYKRDIRRLQKVYADKIDIFLGLEFDMYSETPLEGYDYTLGALHYLKKDGEMLGFDRDAVTVQKLIDEHFEGDGMKLVRAYYEEIANLPQYGKFDIVAHFDTVIKTVEQNPFVDIESKAYLDCAFEALRALKDKIPFFEVNTGAVGRGYRTAPYPTLDVLKEMHRLGIRLTLSSDCHDKNLLTCGFDEAVELMKAAGYREMYVLKKHGFTAVPLEG